MFKTLSSMETWRRNMYVLWFGVFMSGIGFSSVMPFLPLYVDTLGNFSRGQLTFYSGLVFSITFLVTALVSPMWGRLADRRGRRLMLLRASLGMAVVFFLMGLVTNVWQLMFLRALQGFFGGFISNANAMVATQTPKEKSGYALGTLVTGVTAGQLLGPFIGGAIASVVSYRVSFFVTGSLLFAAFLLVLFFVKEEFTPIAKGASPKLREVFKMVSSSQLTIGLFITTMIIQAVNTSISPIVALFVRELTNNSANSTFLAGIVAAMPGIATMIAAPRFGVIGDRIGTHRMIFIGFLFAFAVFVPTTFVTSVTMLAILRFLVGISDATMLPAVQTLLTKTTPHEITSRVFAYNQSFQSIGAVLGPLLGTAVASAFDYRWIFLFSALLIALNAILFWFNTKAIRNGSINYQ